MSENTFIVPVLQEAYIHAMIESLEKYAGHKYQLILIDQRPDKTPMNIKADLIIQTSRNLGFAKAMNTGIKLATTEYITYANDDIVFFDERWWQGIKDTFGKLDNMLAVNPLSPKEPGWGYGVNTPDWGEREGDFVYPKDKGIRAPEDCDYDYLLQYKRGWIDGIAGWCVTLNRDRMYDFFEKEKDINPHRLWFDERFYPGSGEDYDVCHRGYGKGFRMVATCSSWVWHHWGKGQAYANQNPAIIDNERRWNKLNVLWKEDEVDGWKSPIFGKPHKRVEPVASVDF